MANPVINLGRMAGDNVDSFVKSVQATTDMTNGSLVTITGLVSGQDAVYSVAAPTDVTTQEVLLMHSPEIVDISGYRIDVTDPTQFTNRANTPVRAFHLKVGDTITTTQDYYTGTAVVGQYIVPANGTTTPAAAANLTGNTVVAFQVLSTSVTISVGTTRKPAVRLMVVKSR